MLTTAQEDNSQSIKVKVFYTLRGQKSTRLVTFSINNEDKKEPPRIPISLKTCLWSICSSSPDMICKDHDLSIYTANFQESGHGPSEKRDSLIWEGHGLMSWIMDQSREDALIYGKSDTSTNIDIYIDLQPTMKWIKNDFMSALQKKSFEQFKASSLQTNPHPICNCHVSINSTITLSEESNYNNNNNTEFDRYLRARQQQQQADASPPLPSTRLPSLSSVPVFRPEPIFPSNNTTTASNNEYKRSPPSQKSMYYKKEQDLTLPMPSSYNGNQLTSANYTNADSAAITRRSAFTLASISNSSNEKDHRYLPSNSNSSASSSPSSSPSQQQQNHQQHSNDQHYEENGMYNISNKKRRKNQIIMPASGSSSQTTATDNHHHHSSDNNSSNSNGSSSNNNNKNNQIYQQQQQQHHHQQQQQQQQQQQHNSNSNSNQQVNTAVRTYYEVDRDNQGSYILPVEIDSWTVVDLGTVIYDRPAYHNQRYIYPANYTVRKWYRSMVDPKSDTQYTCRILENGREPRFEVTADDCSVMYSGPTPTTVWTIIVRRAFAIRNQEYGHNPVGPDFFGLRKNTIAKMIQDLPNASKCSQYVWQTFEPAKFNKPGRNRRRADSTLPGSLLGGVNYGLTSNRLTHNTNLTSTQQQYTNRGQHQQQHEQDNSGPNSPQHQ